MTPHASEPEPVPPTTPTTPTKPLALTIEPPKPPSPRRATEPTTPTVSPVAEDPTAPSSPSLSKLSAFPNRPRNRSPFSRSHLRTRSSASSLSAPPMARAHSSPIADTLAGLHITNGHAHRPASPLYGPPSSPSSRRQSPLRRPLGVDDAAPYPSTSAPLLEIDQTISENSELDIRPRAAACGDDPLTPSSPFSAHNTFPRSRRRPNSPLSNLLPSLLHGPSHLHTSISSPTLGKDASAAARYNEAYPSYNAGASSTSYSYPYSHSSSSMPSTPTSLRSRSPSISSLETIADAPDAEAAAQEADCVARLRAAAERDERRKGGSVGLGMGASGRDKRKRWSVCGAERRGDLDLETIWED